MLLNIDLSLVDIISEDIMCLAHLLEEIFQAKTEKSWQKKGSNGKLTPEKSRRPYFPTFSTALNLDVLEIRLVKKNPKSIKLLPRSKRANFHFPLFFYVGFLSVN